jgi:hypothetical protein
VRDEFKLLGRLRSRLRNSGDVDGHGNLREDPIDIVLLYRVDAMKSPQLERFYPAPPDIVYSALVEAAGGRRGRPVRVRKTDSYTRTVSGKLRSGAFGTRGDVVCQVVPADGGSTIRITPHHVASEFLTPNLTPRAQARRLEGLFDKVSAVLQDG